MVSLAIPVKLLKTNLVYLVTTIFTAFFYFKIWRHTAAVLFTEIPQDTSTIVDGSLP